MSRPPASPAGIRLLLSLGAATLFFVAVFRLARPADGQKPNFATTPTPLAPAIAAGTAHADLDETTFSALAQHLRSSQPGNPVLMSRLERLAQTPSDAVVTARRLMAEFPERADEIGTIVIGALLRATAFAPALELAQAGPEASRTGWITLVLSHWTQNRPDDAELITDQLREKGVTAETFSLVAKSWASTAPAQLARYTLNLPPGEYRSGAFQAVMNPWIQQDPADAATCLAQLTEPSERDIMLAALATRTDAAFRPTRQALAWAESIASPELRKAALAVVVREWFGQNPADATRYAEASPSFDPAQRLQLFASLAPPVDPL